MRFVAVDLETANPQMSSICKVGIVTFEDGEEVAAESIYIDPLDYFDPYHVGIHGITGRDVIGAGCFSENHGWLCERLTDQVTICHTHFDRVAISQASALHEVKNPSCRWLDTLRVARRAWPDHPGHGLAKLAKAFGISFRHHDAVEDARTAGLILIRAIRETGIDLEGWFARVESPIRPGLSDPIRMTGEENGPLGGEYIVFTGALTLPRREAAAKAHKFGASVDSGVTKRTTVLVVGDQDIRCLNGDDKSNKHEKAEQLKAAGQAIRIVGESDFLAMCTLPTC